MDFYKINLREVYPKALKDDCVLTAYIPSNTKEVDINRKKKAILVLPGGAYWMVSDREAEPIALKFASMGYNAYVLNYSTRGRSEAIYPEQLLQSLSAIKFIRENKDKDSTDENKVFAVGFSAGGHLCGMTGLLYNEPVAVAALGKKTNLRPDGICLSYAVISSGEYAHKGSFENLTDGDKTLAEKLSLENCVTPDSPPAFIWHTADDGAVPSMNALLIAGGYAKVGVPYELHIYKSGVHGLSLGNEIVGSNCPAVWEWPDKADLFFKSL